MGLNNYLKKLASECLIKIASPEQIKIKTSVNFISDKLIEEFGNQIKKIEVFGSYTRGTMLPRHLDQYSDVDIMIVFDTKKHTELKPESYREQLKRFANTYYKGSLVKKDFPSIVIEMGHIKIDLISAVDTKSWLWGTERIYIPSSGNEWLKSSPNEFNEELTQVNKKYNSVVKPIIRLLKLWNAGAKKPFESYDLETQISKMNFKGDNVETGLIYAVDKLSGKKLNVANSKKLETLNNRAEKLQLHLKNEDDIKAKRLLYQIFKT